MDDIVNEYQRFDMHTFYNYKKNINVNLKGWKEVLDGRVDWSFDEFGFVKTPNQNNIKNLIEKKVVVFGGSTVFGVGSSSLETTIPSYLQLILNTENNDYFYRVYNAGVRGFFSYLEMVRYLNDVRGQIDPDIIIVLNGRNDIYLASKGYLNSNFDTEYSNNLENNLESNLSKLQFKNSLKSILFSTNTGILIYRILYKYFFPIINNSEEYIDIKIIDVGDDLLKKSLDNYLFIMDNFKDIVEKEDREFYWFLQPSAQYQKQLTELEKNRIKKVSNYLNEIKDWEEKLLFSYEYLLRKNQDIINISNIFKDNLNTVYIDDCHYNDLGSKLIASKIAGSILGKK